MKVARGVKVSSMGMLIVTRVAWSCITMLKIGTLMTASGCGMSCFITVVTRLMVYSLLVMFKERTRGRTIVRLTVTP